MSRQQKHSSIFERHNAHMLMSASLGIHTYAGVGHGTLAGPVHWCECITSSRAQDLWSRVTPPPPSEEPQQILELEDFICMAGVSYTWVSENSRTPSRADGQETNNDACLFLQPFVLAWLHSTVRKTHLA